MPFSFTEIEKRKTHLIGGMFVFLFVSYAVFIVGLLLAVKLAAILGLGMENSFSLAQMISDPYRILTRTISSSEAGIALAFGFLAALIHWLFVSHDMAGKVLRIVGARALKADIPEEKVLAFSRMYGKC